MENCFEKHPAVNECALLGIKDEDGLAKAKMFLVLREGFEPTEQTAQKLRRYGRKNLALYKVPKTFEFMPQPLPKTGQGKIDRQKLLTHNENNRHTFSFAAQRLP